MYASVLHPDQSVTMFYRAQPMCDDDDGQLAFEGCDGLHDGAFCTQVKSTGGFVQDQDIGSRI